MGIKLVYILIGLGLLLQSQNAGKCLKEKEIIQDFKEYFGLEKYAADEEIEFSEIELKTGEDKILFFPLSCGSGGCEYAFYSRINAHCFKRVFDLRGQFQIMEKEINGFPVIKVVYKDGYLSEQTTRFYSYSTEEDYYVKID